MRSDIQGSFIGDSKIEHDNAIKEDTKMSGEREDIEWISPRRHCKARKYITARS